MSSYSKKIIILLIMFSCFSIFAFSQAVLSYQSNDGYVMFVSFPKPGVVIATQGNITLVFTGFKALSDGVIYKNEEYGYLAIAMDLSYLVYIDYSDNSKYFYLR